MDQANVDVTEETEESEESVTLEEDTSTTRSGLHSFYQSCLSAFTLFFCGSMLAFPGGLLLGRTGVVTLRSLERLADDKRLMDHLENYMNTVIDYYFYISDKMNIAHRSNNVHVFNVFISVLAEEFGALTAVLSLAVGLTVGSNMYKLAIKKSGETAPGKALSVAGPLCLMVISSTGCLLGLLMHMYLSVTLTVIACFYFVLVVSLFLVVSFENCDRCSLLFSVLTVYSFSPLNTPIVLSVTFLVTFMFQTKLILSVAVISKMSLMSMFAESNVFNLIVTSIILSLMITDVFNFARHPIVILQQTNTTSSTSAAVEGVYVGVLSCHFLMIVVGMSLFSIKKVTGAGKVCAGAVASGGAAIAGIESAVSVLGPGPTIGALMGVAGAVGVALAAAKAKTLSYGEKTGRNTLMGLLGVTAGTAVSAYLISTTHSGLSALFMGLCAATVPGTLIMDWVIVVLKRQAGRSIIDICFYVLIGVLAVIWLYLITPIQTVLTLLVYMIVSTFGSQVFSFVHRFLKFCRLTVSNDKKKDDSDSSSPEAQSKNRLERFRDSVSLSNLSKSKQDILENLYKATDGKLVDFSKSLRRRVRSSESNTTVDSM